MYLGIGSFIGKTHENNTAMRLSISKYLLSEILVIGNQYRFRRNSLRDDFFIIYTPVVFKYGYNVVALTAKPSGDCRSRTLIYDEFHLFITNGKG